MYSTSNDFKTAIKEPIITYKLNGTIGADTFTEDDILKGSLSISNQCGTNEELQIGSVYIGALKMTLLKEMNRFDVVGKEITLECGVKLPDESFEFVPMGIFVIAEANKTASGLVITAYDYMTKLDADIPFKLQLQGTPYAIASYIASECGLTLAQADFDNFPNHDQTLILYPENDIETYRDMVFYLAQTMGCFTTINRDGELDFRSYGMGTDDTLDTAHRFSGGSFADYTTYYTHFRLTNAETGYWSELQTSFPGHTEKMIYDFGSNPFMQYGNAGAIFANAISNLGNFTYIPFSVQLPANPAYDLGDLLRFPGGLGDSDLRRRFCITKYTWNYSEKISISGGGKNPNSANVKDANSKRIDSMQRSKSDEGLIVYYSFTNTSDIDIADGSRETIIDIRYSATKKTVAIFLAELLAEIETTVNGIIYNDGKATFLYYFDSVLVNRTPKETWTDGDHIKHLLYYLTTDGGVIHQLQIQCEMNGGSAHIPSGAIKACIYGQNLVASDDWAGIIRVNDTPTDWNLIDITFETLTDSVRLETT